MNALLFALLLFWQDPDCRSCDTLTPMVSALSEGDEVKFMGFLDKSMPDYSAIQVNVSGLIAQNDVASSLDVLSESGDADRIVSNVDWFVELTSKNESAHVSRRRMKVTITQAKKKGHWKVVGIEPLSILDPLPQ